MKLNINPIFKERIIFFHNFTYRFYKNESLDHNRNI